MEPTVWITEDVALPQRVLDAHLDGSLVFFVGAGASLDPPSALPLFGDLARQLASMARVPYNDPPSIDFFLGSMPEDFDLHVHARDLLTVEESKPNATHDALVRVASAAGPLRIVTTNFDDHLSTSAKQAGMDALEKWIGPALPLGIDFTGIVHLHGSVLRNPHELVLTDGDFGRAYLTHAWATRFLMPMFERFTVVFVGYSHDDPIMRYLALGLPSRTPRFAFTSMDRANDSKWGRLGVETVSYPVRNGDHGALAAALRAWDRRARMGQADHQSRVTAIVVAGTTMTPVDRDYLTGRIRTVEGAREFAAATAEIDDSLMVEWLRWVEALPQFKSLFEVQGGDSAAALMGGWFADRFIGSPDLSGAGLQCVQRLGQTMSVELFRAAAFHARRLAKSDPLAGRRWKVLLATSVHGHSAPVDPGSMLAFREELDAESPAILRAMLTPLLVLKRRWGFDGEDKGMLAPDAQVSWNLDEDDLTAHVLQAVAVSEPGDEKLRALLEQALHAAYDLLHAYHGDRAWDGLSFSRSAIEPHQQDQYREPLDAVVDGLRAYGERASVRRGELIARWWGSERALFQRLALHLLAMDGALTSDQKVDWLLARDLTYRHEYKHEVYRVLAAASPELGSLARGRLLAAVQAGPGRQSEGGPDLERHDEYLRFNLLHWLVAASPDWLEAQALLTSVREANPDFEPREHPDLDHWTSSGTWGESLPEHPEAFAMALAVDATAAMDRLLAHFDSERLGARSEWSGLLSLVKQVTASSPEHGDSIWRYTGERELDTGRVSDLRRAVVEGWSSADLGAFAATAASRVRSIVKQDDYARVVSGFLLQQGRKNVESADSPVTETMRAIAGDLWHHHGAVYSHAGWGNVLSSAPLYLNSWPGEIVAYWMVEVDRRWRQERDSWSGLDDEESHALAGLIEANPDARDATVGAVASEAFFMFAADAEFSTAHILPLFGQSDSAHLAWHAYLHHPRYNDKMLGAGLLDGVLTEWARVADLESQGLERQFLGMVASIVSFAGISDRDRQELLDQSVLANGGSFAAVFGRECVRLIKQEKVDGADLWVRWLGAHLSSRLRGVPRRASDEELASWVDVAPYVGTSISDALNLVSGRQVVLGERFRAPGLAQEVWSIHGSRLVAHYIERIRNSTPGDRFVAHQLRKLIAEVRSALGDAQAEAIKAAAVERGFGRVD